MDQLAEKVTKSLTTAICSAIEEQLGTAWVFDNLDDTIGDELKLLTRDLIRQDDEIRAAMKDRLLDLIDPVYEDEDEEEVSGEPEEVDADVKTKSTPKAGTKSAKSKTK